MGAIKVVNASSVINATDTIGAMGAMGNSLGNIFNEVSSKLDDSITP